MALFAADSVWFNATSTGLGDFVVASAVSGYRTPAGASVPNGSTIHYSARAGTDFENGEGIYNSGTLTLARTTIFASSNSNAKVNFASVPTVALVPLAEDVIFPPASSTDGAIALWSGTGGDTLQNSNLLVSGSILSGGNTASTDFVIQTTTGVGTSDDLIFRTGSQIERLRIDTNGHIISSPSGNASLAIGGQEAAIQNIGNTLATGAISLDMFNATAANGAHIDFYRSKSGTVGSSTVVANGDVLGELYFWGAQQTGTFGTQNAAAKISALVDGVVTSGAGADMPGRIAFFTTPDGSGTLAERLRIQQDGSMVMGGVSKQFGSGAGSFEINSASATYFSTIRWDATAAPARMHMAKSRGPTIGTVAALSSGDEIGEFIWSAPDTNLAWEDGASIAVFCDAAPGSNNQPTRMVFSTANAAGGGFVTEAMRIDQNQNVTVRNGGGLGYGGGGSTVSQGTSRTTGVTINAVCGAITLFSGTPPAAGTYATFTVTNSSVAATDLVIVSVKSSNAANVYTADVSAIAAGSFKISVLTVSGSTSDAPVINFAVFKAVTTA